MSSIHLQRKYLKQLSSTKDSVKQDCKHRSPAKEAECQAVTTLQTFFSCKFLLSTQIRAAEMTGLAALESNTQNTGLALF